MVSLLELVDGLTRIERPVGPLSASVPAFDPAPNPVEGYVWPDVRDFSESTNAGVLLIEAAGAVGKSAAAEAMASRLNWPLVTAARGQVGSYSLSGLVHDALGFGSSFLADLSHGEAGLIVDALDEAHLKAGTSNFLAFLENVRHMAPATHGRPGIVLFSRPDTAVLVKEFFSQSRAPISSARIDFLSAEQARKFVESYVHRMARQFPERDYFVAVNNPVPFGQLRDKRLLEVAQILSKSESVDLNQLWPGVRTFLGYAPVLAVLAEFITVKNFASEIERTWLTERRTSAILLQVIDNILRREQFDKFQASVLGKLVAHMPADVEWADSSFCYGPEEQVLRLLRKLLGSDIVGQVPATLPAEISAEYDSDVNQFISDHPFMAGNEAVNVVFKDYLLAKAVTDPLAAVCLEPNPMIAVEQRSNEVGPFFADFVHEFSVPLNEKIVARVVAERLISSLLYSVNAASLGRGNAFSFFEDGQTAVLVIGLSSKDKDAGRERLNFVVEDLSGVLSLPDRLSNGIILTDAAVVLGRKDGHVLLGPNLRLFAAELIVEASRISVEAGAGDDDDDKTVIGADDIQITSTLKVDAPRRGSLEVMGENPWPVLRPFIVSRRAREFVARSDYVDLRAILKAFRQGAGEAPSVFSELLGQRVIGSNKKRTSYLKALQTLGIVYGAGSSHYYLNKKDLASRGVNWESFMTGEPSMAVLDFIAELNMMIAQ